MWTLGPNDFGTCRFAKHHLGRGFLAARPFWRIQPDDMLFDFLEITRSDSYSSTRPIAIKHGAKINKGFAVVLFYPANMNFRNLRGVIREKVFVLQENIDRCRGLKRWQPSLCKFSLDLEAFVHCLC
jgi:hypothetical protein